MFNIASRGVDSFSEGRNQRPITANGLDYLQEGYPNEGNEGGA